MPPIRPELLDELLKDYQKRVNNSISKIYPSDCRHALGSRGSVLLGQGDGGVAQGGGRVGGYKHLRGGDMPTLLPRLPRRSLYLGT
jgi:hypothetical protein